MSKFNRVTGNQPPPLPRKSRDILFADSRRSPIVNRVWCIAHRPDKCEQGEESALIRTGEYWMWPDRTCPLPSIQSINVGDEVNMRIRTCMGVRGPLKNPGYKDYYRRGIVTRAPHPGFHEDRPGCFCMNIKWDPVAVPTSCCTYKNAPRKTLTMQ